jgi:hypothetical protein
MVIFRRGNRLLTLASLILLLEAAGHTMGTLSPLPDEPDVQELAHAMRELRTPLGLGMEPSAWDINRGLALTMSVTLLLMAVAGLAVPAAAPDNRRVYRVIAGILCGANLAMLAIWWFYRVPPPLMFQAILTPLLVAAAFGPAPQASAGAA